MKPLKFLFRRKPAPPLPDPAPGIVNHDNGYRAPVEPRVGIGATIARVLPVGRIVDQLAGIMRDPNGKLSSKRAGAGALVVAAISFLNEGRTREAVVCLVFAIMLFALTKFPPDQAPNA